MSSETIQSGRKRLLIGGLFLAVILVAVWTLPLEAWLDAASGWIDAHPLQGRALFVVAFVVGVTLMIPGSVLFMSGGYLFGFLEGFPLVAICTGLGAAAAYLIGRTIARDWVASQVASSARFQALDRALEQKGVVVVMLSRLSLILPYNVLNYMYSITKISLVPYSVATLVGMLPAVALFVYLGSAAQNVEQIFSDSRDTGPLGPVLLIGGLLAVIAASVIVQRAAAKALREDISS
jgi:uncharacterized membrane protein YdjX (TVP38/TMEM64 family)